MLLTVPFCYQSIHAFVGGFLAGAIPVALSHRDEQLDLEEGALDPDELEGEPLYWDEGSDDELG